MNGKRRRLIAIGIAVLVLVVIVVFITTRSNQSLPLQNMTEEWWEDCPGLPECTPPATWPVQPTYTPGPTPTCLSTPTCEPYFPSPTPYLTSTPYPPQPTFGPVTCTPTPTLPVETPSPTPAGTSAAVGVHWDSAHDVIAYQADNSIWQLYIDVEIRQDSEVLATQTITTGLGTSTEQGDGIFDGPLTWDWDDWQFEGIVEEWIRLRWSAEHQDDVWGFYERDGELLPRDERGFSLRRIIETSGN